MNDTALWHDLREPIRGIVTNLMIANNGPGAPNEYVDLALALAVRVGQMFERVAEYHQVENGGCDLLDVDLADVARIAAENVQHVLAEAKTKLVIQEMPTVVSDRYSLIRVIQNLLENAAKYCPGAEVVIGHKSGLGMFVQDNGPGIRKDCQEQAFLPFNQIDGTGKGTGMGLAICKKLLKQVGGDIWIDNDFMEGTRFIVSYYSALGGQTDELSGGVRTPR